MRFVINASVFLNSYNGLLILNFTDKKNTFFAESLGLTQVESESGFAPDLKNDFF